MHLESQNQKELYHHIGKLFYAIAASDKQVSEEEIAQMKAIISAELLVQDEIGVDADCQIENAFDWCVEEGADYKRCFDEFKEFKQEHGKLFSPNVIKMIVHTSNAIAAAVSNHNKTEHSMLTEIKKILHQSEN